MSNEPNNLQQLWQRQAVSPVDVSALKKHWNRIRIKQYLYITLDAAALLAMPLIIFLVPKQMSSFERYWLGCVFTLLAVWFAYMLWLRRYSLGFQVDSGSTTEYVERVKLQYQQNIRIARLNKQLCFALPFVFITYIAIGYWGDLVSHELLWKKAKIMLILLFVSLPLTWVWAHKRELKFKQLLLDFETRWSL